MRGSQLLRFLGIGCACLVLTQGAGAAEPASGSAEKRIAAVETRIGGRLGVAALETGSGRRIAHGASERFPMCSTFKFLAAAAVLHRVDINEEKLDRVISYTEADLLEYAPAAKEHLREGGMTVGALCAAAITLSDNTAANLLLKTIGGPAGFTRYARTLGDKETRLDRIEPDLNSARPGDERDTTTPAAMLGDLRALLLGDALSASSRAQLDTWLAANTTGGSMIRAGLPNDWKVGDKTGRGAEGSTNDIAIIRPPGRAHILLTVYSVGSTASPAERTAAVAEVARIVAETFRK
ncbi:MAG: class A beta-lactamase [Spartobacteria bacterium]